MYALFLRKFFVTIV